MSEGAENEEYAEERRDPAGVGRGPPDLNSQVFEAERLLKDTQMTTLNLFGELVRCRECGDIHTIHAHGTALFSGTNHLQLHCQNEGCNLSGTMPLLGHDWMRSVETDREDLNPQERELWDSLELIGTLQETYTALRAAQAAVDSPSLGPPPSLQTKPISSNSTYIDETSSTYNNHREQWGDTMVDVDTKARTSLPGERSTKSIESKRLKKQNLFLSSGPSLKGASLMNHIAINMTKNEPLSTNPLNPLPQGSGLDTGNPAVSSDPTTLTAYRNPFKPLKKRDRENPASGKESKKYKAMEDRGEPLQLSEAMDAASSDLEGDSDGDLPDNSTPPSRAEYNLLLMHNKQLQAQIESLTREVTNMRVAMEKMSTQRPLANSPNAVARSSSYPTRGRGGKSTGPPRAKAASKDTERTGDKETLSYLLKSSEDVQELKDILALPLEDRDRALIDMLKPLLEPLHPEPEYLFDLLDWLLLTESHDNEYIFKLLTEPSDAVKKVLASIENNKLNNRMKEKDKGATTQSYATAAAKAPRKTEAELKQQQARAKERNVAMSFFQEKAPQEWKSATIRWYPGRQYKDPRALNSLAWRAMEKMKIRSAVKDLCLIGKQLIRIYYCEATATKVEAAILAANLSVVTDLKSTPSFDSKADIKASTINRASYLLAKHSSISRLCTLIIQEVPAEWMEECREKANQRAAINNARHQ